MQGACNSVGVAGFYPHGGAQAGIHTEMESMGERIHPGTRNSFCWILQFREKGRTKNPSEYLDYYQGPVQVIEVVSSYSVVTSFTGQIFQSNDPYAFFFLFILPEEERML